MRIVLVTYGSRGDVGPVTALARRLAELDVDVQMCAPPDFAELLDGDGVLTPLGWPIRMLATGRVPGRTSLSDIAADLTAMAYEAVTGLGEGCAAVVATGSFPAVAGARAAAEKLGLPYVFTTFSPNSLPAPHHPPLPWPGQAVPEGVTGNRELWALNAQHMNALFGETVNAHRASVGLPPVEALRDHVFGDRLLLAADPVLGPWQSTPELGVVQTGAWIRPDDRPLPDDLEAFLAAGPPPVYVGFGSMLLRGAPPQEVSRSVIRAVRSHGRRVVLSSGWADLSLIDEAADCFIVGEANHQALFPRTAAVVHHGGAGTTVAAARAGVPQVIVPQVADQPYWAARVTDLGIGAAHDGPTPTTESLAAALKPILTPETAARAATVSQRIRSDGAQRAAELVLDIARSAPTP
ncbi:glycosyltransferase [Actinocorallia libanotica]|uniref:Glycosyltransferase n=1 Tax=Actinocorallia libanotica TaxID=46162 RepID=A0ABN1S0L7_9ACTN